MALDSTAKAQVVQDYQRFAGDTGSPEVQIALLTKAIEVLAPHFAANKKDHHSRRGLQTMVNKRRSMLDYLKRVSFERYKDLIERLKIRR